MKEQYKMKILIADNSKLIRDLIIRSIGKGNARLKVEQAKDGLEAMEKYHDFEPDVIILDICMPHKNGIQVLDDLSKNRNKSTVFVFTNYHYPQYRKKCLSLGADRFYVKSAEFKEMFAELDRMIINQPVSH